MITLNKDCLLRIALHADFQTTLQLVKVCSFEDNFWRLKCQIKFPDKHYIEQWTGIENYLVGSKKKFALAINFDNCNCDSPVYEYDKMLKNLISLFDYLRHNYDCLFSLVKIEIKNNFVLLSKNKQDGTIIIAYHPTKKNAMKTLPLYGNDKLKMYAIVNLGSCIPWFFKFGQNKNRKCKNWVGSFFYKKEYESDDISSSSNEE